jgi:acetyl esterase/lipase
MTTVRYGDHPEQVAHLRLPAAGASSVPVVVLLHGGFWRAKWALDLMDALAIDLARRGYASWNVEYRRANEHDWPAMAGDVEAAVAHLSEVGRPELDLRRIVLVGHSAGGQLAVQATAGLATRADAPRPALVVQLAGVADVEEAWRRDLGDGAVRDALGGRPPDGPEPWTMSPMELQPLGVPQLVVIGASDSADLREMGRRYAAAARAAGDQVDLAEEPGDHFDLIDPRSAAWSRTVELIEQVTGPVSVGPSDDER